MVVKSALFELAKALEGIPVLGCLQGTPAALAGVQYGDVLLSVNGVRTRTFADYIEAKALRNDGMHVVVFRSGQERPMEFEYNASRRPVNTSAMLAELIEMRVLPVDVPEGVGPLS